MTSFGNKMPSKEQEQDSFRHDLRTHISAILSLVELIKKNPDSQPSSHLLDALHLAADNALALMDGGIHKALTPVGKSINLCQLLEDFTLLAEGLVLSCQARFTLCLKETLSQDPLMDLDPVQLHRVLMLLLDNALHYARGAELTLTADRLDADRICLTFQDNGPGFEEDNPEFLFQPYHRGTSHHHLQGSGLGLWSARNILSAMGGTITARNASPHGAIFEINLPTSSPQLQKTHLSDQSQTQASEEVAQILVVDDNKTNHLIMGEILSALGAECHHALSGQSALAILQDLKPKQIFIDIRMPEIDGWDLARLIRQNSAWNEIPLIAISADNRPRNIQHFAHWLQRPIRPTDLAAFISQT